MAMHNAVLLINENATLCTENQRQKQKQSKSVAFIVQEGVLTVQEGQNHTQLTQNPVVMTEEQIASQSRTCASPQYNLCSLYEHTACTCVQCIRNNS